MRSLRRLLIRPQHLRWGSGSWRSGWPSVVDRSADAEMFRQAVTCLCLSREGLSLAEVDDCGHIKATADQLAHKLKRAMDRGTGTTLTPDEVHFLGISTLREWVENVCAGTAI